MANITKKQQQQITANNTITHNFEVGKTYELTLERYDPKGKIVRHDMRFTKYQVKAVYVGGDHKNNHGFMMAMFKLETETVAVNGFTYDSLAKINPTLVAE